MGARGYAAALTCALALAAGCNTTPEALPRTQPPVPDILTRLGGFDDAVWQPVLTAAPEEARTLRRTSALCPVRLALLQL